jgi:hypothetical protein
VSVTNVILTDKDCAELAGIKTVFPNATSLLCHFHVDCAVDTRLNKAKLETNHQEEIYQSFQRAMHAESEEQIKKEEQYLCNIGNSERINLITYSLSKELLCISKKTNRRRQSRRLFQKTMVQHKKRLVRFLSHYFIH